MLGMTEPSESAVSGMGSGATGFRVIAPCPDAQSKLPPRHAGDGQIVCKVHTQLDTTPPYLYLILPKGGRTLQRVAHSWQHACPAYPADFMFFVRFFFVLKFMIKAPVLLSSPA